MTECTPEVKILLVTYGVRLVRHERLASVFMFDDAEYEVRHTDIHLKHRLLSVEPGTLLDVELYVVLPEE